MFSGITLSMCAMLGGADTGIQVIPFPAQAVTKPGTFAVTSETIIAFESGNADAEQTAHYLAETLRPATGFALPVRAADGPKEGTLFLGGCDEDDLGDEGYTLATTPKHAVIKAPGAAGLFYGAQTIRQLLPPDVFADSPRTGIKWTMPCVEIRDVPRFPWRGMLLDPARHFIEKGNVKAFIDLMALHKLNRLHMHLTDDQGWRVEIKKYPRLTEVGAWRKETLVGHAREEKKQYDGKRHGGFYSQDDVRELVAYAAERHVVIVPEIEMPGHAQAAVAAYPELGCTDEQLEVLTYWGVNENVFNVEETTIAFLQDVLAEVLDLFPSEFIHIGGDECPKKQWKESERVQTRMRDLGIDTEEELQSWFVRQMDAFLTEQGRRLIGWDEILEGGLAPGATVMSWRGVEGGIAAARAKHDVVMSPVTHTYFDYYQGNPEAEPLAIGGNLPLETVYDFEPIPADLTPAEAQHVLGAQAQLWTEYIRAWSHLEYMAFPRACALAEVVWSPREGKDFAAFKARLQRHLQRLDLLKVNYRDPRE
ncbi:MAG: beta-N-acetylhexosaminidase [bacterium]|nr:beta-N-acetylhexosaminidase [bacterium]